ncbi:hypothetical protein pEaSNUABM40_00092 [Erwinia phage pEa_SNUABM_40]|uniref:Uncharacterized protein n=1 Tax=Erwinia phage pEa_SNUABM_3 TaxID=2869552 RepID=A0AAE8BYI0_9CAUD|nr:hypothetical protein MPK68_gp092 [Erwinia phage pEa_SNUABM_3]QZE56289.1 hypothetical protein pEaSNUABM3_00092 [Erwinia phage pEa_SNUABM_3]QZE58308.1 hypothetical protein pEaSNUABM40_00092 [Erwinia phage pEa_SNUABM_40]
MLFATYHNKKANNIATLALHRAMYFDDQADLSDAHLDEAHYLSKIPKVRAWGNSADTNAQSITLSPMSGIKDNYFYPARSANLISGVSAVHNSYTTAQTPKATAERYFCVYDSAVGNGQQWSNGNPVFNGWNGPSKDTCESGYYWPSQSMLVFPNGLRQSASIETYSSKAGNQYARSTDPFWGTYSGYDAGYMNASMNLSTLQETVTQSYVLISTTATPMQDMQAQSLAADHIVFVRPVGKRYSANGLNQFTSLDVPTTSNGVSGYDRTAAAAFNMRVAVTGKSNTPDVTLSSCMMMFKCNGQGYMLRAKIGQDIIQTAPAATGDVAVLNIESELPFGSKTLYLM